MTLFFCCALLLMAAVVQLIHPLWSTARSPVAPSGLEANAEVYRRQLRELGEQRQSGALGDEQYATERDDLETRLAADLRARARAAPPRVQAAQPRTALAAWILVAVPAATVTLYSLLGTSATPP